MKISSEEWDEFNRMVGEPVYCQRCYERGGRHTVVAFLSEEEGGHLLMPAEFVDGFDDPEDAQYLPRIRGPVVPDQHRRVALKCRQCRKSCGEWTAKTIRKRLDRGLVTVA